jgi:hypothetical protein
VVQSTSCCWWWWSVAWARCMVPSWARSSDRAAAVHRREQRLAAARSARPADCKADLRRGTGRHRADEPLGLYGRWLKMRTYSTVPVYRRGLFKRQKAFTKSSGCGEGRCPRRGARRWQALVLTPAPTRRPIPASPFEGGRELTIPAHCRRSVPMPELKTRRPPPCGGPTPSGAALRRRPFAPAFTHPALRAPQGTRSAAKGCRIRAPAHTRPRLCTLVAAQAAS